MTDGDRAAGAFSFTGAAKLSRRGGKVFVFLLIFLSLFGPRAPSAHEVIPAEQVDAVLAAAYAADARVKSAAGSPAEGEAKPRLLGAGRDEDIFNRDLAAHSGRLSFNGNSLQKALAQRNLSPRFDDRSAATGCRAPRSRKRFGFRRGTRCAAGPLCASESRLLRELRARSFPARRVERRRPRSADRRGAGAGRGSSQP